MSAKLGQEQLLSCTSLLYIYRELLFRIYHTFIHYDCIVLRLLRGKIMKKNMVILMMAISVLVSAACSQQEAEEEPKFLDVLLKVNPTNAQVNEEITFEAKVTYGSEEVKDADEVKFEIWRSKAEVHEKIVVEHQENGIYRLKKGFSEEGTYYIITHVTARGMHNMPKTEFVVGKPSEPEESESEMDDMEKDKEEDQGHKGH